jgi:quercetin dioxygenase-like cupin family protein
MIERTSSRLTSTLSKPSAPIQAEKANNEILYVPNNAGQQYWVMGTLFTFLVTGAESGGSYFTLIVTVPPDAGPPPHVHHLEEEQFYVLRGNVTFSVGEQTFEATTGDFIHIPRETIHSFRNGSSESILLATFSPAGIEGFFRGVGDPVNDRSSTPPVTEETIARFLAAESAGWKDHHDTLPPPSAN